MYVAVMVCVLYVCGGDGVCTVCMWRSVGLWYYSDGVCTVCI